MKDLGQIEEYIDKICDMNVEKDEANFDFQFIIILSIKLMLICNSIQLNR